MDKICTKCSETKNVIEFGITNNVYNSKCKKCINELAKKYRAIKKISLPKKPAIIDKKCTKCGEVKNVNEFSFKDSRKKYLKSHCKICCNESKKIYYYENRDEILKKSKTPKGRAAVIKAEKKYYKKNKVRMQERAKDPVFKKNRNKKIVERLNKKKLNPQFAILYKVKSTISRQVVKALKAQNGSKNKKSVLDYLPYSIEELKVHIESQWEDWMTWENHGIYKMGGDRKWHIDHIIPQSLLPYNSMEHPNFLKCWALNNLRPLDAIQNIIKSDKNNVGTNV